MTEEQKWPDVIWIARHGESAGNVAREAAEAAGHPLIQIATRDMDVPLSSLGERQATALGRWLGKMPPEERPTVLLTSPYIRARETAGLALAAAGIEREEITFIVDERLREKECGVLDRLTKLGIQQHYPEQADFRQAIGKFYPRPPGGESWCDVLLRLRSAARRAASEWRAVVALKGAATFIAAPGGETYCNRTGNVVLAISGSGDTLAGIVAGLAARGADPLQAAVWAVDLHGSAGDRLARRMGRLGFRARELLAELPGLMAELQED